MLLGGIHIQVL